MSVGDILGESWETYKRHWRHLIPLAVGFYAVLGLITLLLSVLFGLVGAAVAAVVNVLGIWLLVGTLVEAIADVRDGRADLTYGQTIERARTRFWPLFVAGVLVTLGVFLGLILLIVPGLILLTRWSMFAPLVVLEGAAATDSPGASNNLVKDHSWTVFGVLLITFILVNVFTGIVSAILSPLADWLQSYLSNVIGSGIAGPFAAAAVMGVYFRLRGEKAVVEPAPSPVVS